MFGFLKPKRNEEKVDATEESIASDTSSQTPQKAQKAKKAVNLLVVDAHSDENFYELFRNCHLSDGRAIRVEQSGWRDLSLTAYSDSLTPVANIRSQRQPIPGTPQSDHRVFQPHFALIRNVVTTLKQDSADHRNLLFALMFAQVPCVNSLRSIYCMMERPLMNAELIRLHREHGAEAFPIITQYFYPNHSEMVITPHPYPLVVKMGNAGAGFGKMLVHTHKEFQDLRSVVACTSNYATAENYIEGDCDLRIQKIGDTVCAWRRRSTCGNWKTNTGSAILEPIEMQARYEFWASECAKCFGGMDIVTVDVLVSKEDGKEFILEFNGTASGFGDKAKDNIALRDLVLHRMDEHFCKSTDTNSNSNN